MPSSIESGVLVSYGPVRRLTVGSYFDGERLHRKGPYLVLLDGDSIAAIERSPDSAPPDIAFLMPTLVDAHVHVFLDGRELDPVLRKRHRLKDRDALLATARANASAAWQAGIALLRDGGDPHGINDALRGWLQSEHADLRLRSCAVALHRAGRYGSFLGRAVAHDDDLVPLVREVAKTADHIKVLLTGPIDFATGAAKGAPQFDAAAASTIVRTAREAGKLAFAHCNGAEGLQIALAAKFDSVEHGYGMNEELLRRMAGEGIAWTPTLAPVAALRHLPTTVTRSGNEALAQRGPQQARFWPVGVELDGILSRHHEAIARAAQLGLTLLCGSDAGSQGVPHGSGLIDEIILMAATGVPMETILKAATSTPRMRWGEPSASLMPGSRFTAIALPQSPFEASSALRCVSHVAVD